MENQKAHFAPPLCVTVKGSSFTCHKVIPELPIDRSVRATDVYKLHP